MGVAVGVEHINNREFAQRQCDVVGRLGATQRVGRRFVRRGGIPQCEYLAREGAIQAEVGRRLADLVGLAAGKSGHSDGVAEAEPLIDFGIDVKRRARPQADAQKNG